MRIEINYLTYTVCMVKQTITLQYLANIYFKKKKTLIFRVSMSTINS